MPKLNFGFTAQRINLVTPKKNTIFHQAKFPETVLVSSEKFPNQAAGNRTD
jgi:hypothetical protein